MTGQNDLRALVVDDVKLYREVMRRWLIDEHIATSTANNGNEAWQIFRTMRPSLVVSDIDMAGGNGFELIARIRQLDAQTGSHTKVVIMSSLLDHEIESFALRAGGDGFIAKPLSKTRTMDLITDVLSCEMASIGNPRGGISVNDRSDRYRRGAERVDPSDHQTDADTDRGGRFEPASRLFAERLSRSGSAPVGFSNRQKLQTSPILRRIVAQSEA